MSALDGQEIPPSAKPPTEVPPDVRIDSRAAFREAALRAFEHATAGASRRIVCVDPDFADWPLDDATLLQRMTDWLRRPQRQWVLLASDYARVPRLHPRFVTWRRDWSHAIAPFAAPADLDGGLPTLLLDERGLMLRIVDRTQWRGRLSYDESSARPWREEVDAVLQRCEPAFAVNTLGL